MSFPITWELLILASEAADDALPAGITLGAGA
jgi:hypothetical protein